MMKLPEHLTHENTAAQGLPVRVFLDGVEQMKVLEAHTAEGWLVRAKLDANGRTYADGEDVATERLTGKVTAHLRA